MGLDFERISVSVIICEMIPRPMGKPQPGSVDAFLLSRWHLRGAHANTRTHRKRERKRERERERERYKYNRMYIYT